MFNYTLESGESMFLLTTEKIGQHRFGVLSVRDPALLDREISSHIMVTVSRSSPWSQPMIATGYKLVNGTGGGHSESLLLGQYHELRSQ